MFQGYLNIAEAKDRATVEGFNWNWNLEFFYRLIGEARGELGLVATIGTGLRRDDWPFLAV